MTSAAVEAEFTVMDIIGTMAIAAASTQRKLLVQRSTMTALALHTAVSTIEVEAGLRVVVELPFGPFNRVVAPGAVVFEAVIVRVVFTVAGHAVRRCVFEYMRVMAVTAFR